MLDVLLDGVHNKQWIEQENNKNAFSYMCVCILCLFRKGANSFYEYLSEYHFYQERNNGGGCGDGSTTIWFIYL